MGLLLTVVTKPVMRLPISIMRGRFGRDYFGFSVNRSPNAFNLVPSGPHLPYLVEPWYQKYHSISLATQQYGIKTPPPHVYGYRKPNVADLFNPNYIVPKANYIEKKKRLERMLHQKWEQIKAPLHELSKKISELENEPLINKSFLYKRLCVNFMKTWDAYQNKNLDNSIVSLRNTSIMCEVLDRESLYSAQSSKDLVDDVQQMTRSLISDVLKVKHMHRDLNNYVEGAMRQGGMVPIDYNGASVSNRLVPPMLAVTGSLVPWKLFNLHKFHASNTRHTFQDRTESNLIDNKKKR